MEKPEIFELSWDWWDSYMMFRFTHQNKTAKEFDEDVQMLINKCVSELLSSNTSFIGGDTIIDAVAENLPTLGYVKPDDKMYTKHFGGSGILKTDKDDLEDKNEWEPILGKKVFSDVCEYNEAHKKR